MALQPPPDGFAALVKECIRGTSQSCGELAALGKEHGFDAAVPKLARYLELIVQWNARLDLTAARDLRELVDLFVADASVLALAATDDEDWVDVGSGAGAPGLPLAIMRPELALCLVEPKSKRVSFLRTASATLELGVRIQRARSEEVQELAFAVGVSRATFAPELWLAEGARICRRAVWVLLAQADAPTLPGWDIDLDLAYRWPLTDVSRRAIRFVRK
ncbi:MAG TPA: RsmG family class I SAM-dependent methyltransferase [Polyangiaceae bacterium]|jgi:16S rRNA (guanine527-N7)-methyltransferase|nr:RsmG family class I SAM-dependent methyltransferase [Polyangiaceae bacterium]